MLSKKLPLLLALALAFTFYACESSTSATTEMEEIDSSASGEKVPGSSDSKGDKGNTENSSDSKTNPGSTNSGKTNSSSSKAVNTLDGNLTEQQAELIDMLKEFAAGNEETKKLTESCKDGDKTTQEVMGQSLGFTCMYESWVPTSGMKELVENLDPTIQTMILTSTGMTMEELIELTNFLSSLAPATPNVDVNSDSTSNNSGTSQNAPHNNTDSTAHNAPDTTANNSGNNNTDSTAVTPHNGDSTTISIPDTTANNSGNDNGNNGSDSIAIAPPIGSDSTISNIPTDSAAVAPLNP